MKSKKKKEGIDPWKGIKSKEGGIVPWKGIESSKKRGEAKKAEGGSLVERWRVARCEERESERLLLL